MKKQMRQLRESGKEPSERVLQRYAEERQKVLDAINKARSQKP